MTERGDRRRAREGRSGEPPQDGPGRQVGIRVCRPRGRKWTGPLKHKSLSRDTRVMPSSGTGKSQQQQAELSQPGREVKCFEGSKATLKSNSNGDRKKSLSLVVPTAQALMEEQK